MGDHDAEVTRRILLNKVPEVTLYFWLIKILCTTVGETTADYLNGTFNLGLTGTTYITGSLLVALLFIQFRASKYVPPIYWCSVVLISVVGTLITDNLVDNFGVPLEMTAIAFSIALAASFAAWYLSEHTLSIHTIFTVKREAFYWSAILFTFALGTAAGDLAAEQFGFGYLISAAWFGAGIGIVTVAHFYLRLNPIIAFWVAYILTRPLGASIGDYLSQAPDNGGLGLGTTATTALFLSAILAVIVYLTVTRRDQTAIPAYGPGHSAR